MKRFLGESYGDYRERREKEGFGFRSIQAFIRAGKVFFSGGTYRRKPRIPLPKRVLISPTVGKRHQGESIEHFTERRRICNQKRRKRERERKYRLTPHPPCIGSVEDIIEHSRSVGMTRLQVIAAIWVVVLIVFGLPLAAEWIKLVIRFWF